MRKHSAAAAARAFRDFHGRAPESVRAQRLASAPGWLADIGQVRAVVYDTDRDGELIRATHTFKRSAAPVLARDERGRAHLLGGAYHLGERGFVDMARRRRSHHSRSHHRRRHHRRNPFLGGRAAGSGGSVSKVMEELAIGAGVAVLAKIGTEVLVERQQLSENTAMLAKVAGPLAAGWFLRKKNAAIGYGVMSAGALAGAEVLAQKLDLRMRLESIGAPSNGTPPTQGSSRSGAGLPSGDDRIGVAPAPAAAHPLRRAF